MVKLAECKHKEIAWFHFCESKTFKQKGLVLHICPLYSHIAAQNYVPPSEITEKLSKMKSRQPAFASEPRTMHTQRRY